ncbi:MAG: Ribosomal small subunit methyltransferase [Bacteroidetes bacterium]|nr:Ribosomal small subunit methyltransferase [Bacteroidota bacterium]
MTLTLKGVERVRPRKSLGQNFLRDENICRKIVAAVDAKPSDIVFEIGPGEGALTKYLATTVKRLIVVDLDERVVARMRFMFPDIEVVNGDVLDVDLSGIARARRENIRIVGNIPYNITSPILFHLLDHRAAVTDAMLMVQKEVAQRLVGQPRTKEYGILSVMFQLFTDVEVLFDVSRNAFYPKPDVTSSVIHLTMLNKPRYQLADEQVFRSMVRSLFGKRRKMLRSSLKYFCEEYGYSLPEDLDLTRRPEELPVEELVELSNRLVEAARPQ